MTYELITLEYKGDFATITMNNPKRRNALSLKHMLELTSAFQEVGESNALGVILAANGPAFSAGHDFADVVDRDLVAVRKLLQVCTTLMDTIQEIPQPVLARVHALATAAGCQLVATCDLAVASTDAGFATRRSTAARPRARRRARSGVTRYAAAQRDGWSFRSRHGWPETADR